MKILEKTWCKVWVPLTVCACSPLCLVSSLWVLHFPPTVQRLLCPLDSLNCPECLIVWFNKCVCRVCPGFTLRIGPWTVNRISCRQWLNDQTVPVWPDKTLTHNFAKRLINEPIAGQQLFQWLVLMKFMAPRGLLRLMPIITGNTLYWISASCKWSNKQLIKVVWLWK